MFKKTVDGVLAGFQKTVQDLREIVAREQDVIHDNEAKIANLEVANIAAASERDRASAIADRLSALIS